MLDEKKVRLMARTALYEQDLGSRTIKMNRAFEKGAGRAALLRNLPFGILTFFFVAAFAAAFFPERVYALYQQLGLYLSCIIFAAAAVLFAAGYSFYARYMFRKKYEDQKGVFWKYGFTRDKLKRIEEELPAGSGGADA